MKRISKILILIGLTYFLPLIFKPELMYNFKIISLAIAAAILFLSQPDFAAKDVGDKQQTDNLSMMFILIAGLLSQVIPVIEWAYFRFYESHIITVIGLAMLIGGLAFRIWSIHTLGKFFTATVQIVDGHRVIKTGPYAIVRHPSYLGAYIAIVGSAIFLVTPIGAATAAISMGCAYHKRISVEEQALIEEFGEEYKKYQDTIQKIVPLGISIKKKWMVPGVLNKIGR